MKMNLVVKALFFGITGLALVGQAQQGVKKVAAKPTVAVAGKDLFREYCAVCHGTDGKGGGPAAAALKSAPTDLTQISKRNNGTFPEERMMRMLQGQEAVTAHGSQDMPVWGGIFNNMTPSLAMKQARLHGLMQYLEDLQAK
ncbi:MAG: cytochrome c [Candidatus Sulfopaludibacter sp.]|nr:cytochrome c [Candidatus Sulfopaludibacter sp.]